MSFSLTTSDRSASESLTSGLEAIDRYYEHRRIPDIEMASQCIDAALSRDADYGLAIYYKGVVLDLLGKPADAPQHFERILEECTSPELQIEATFNLGVVNYHRYSHAFLARAKGFFDQVIAKSSDASLKFLAEAHLAQTHAMWMRPSYEQLPDKRVEVSNDVRAHIESHFRACQASVDKLRRVGNLQPRVVAAFENANGMANMYYTDHVVRVLQDREARLKEARASLQLAEQHLPNDWANTCDLGSLDLRRGILARDREPPDLSAADAHFVEAKQRLARVVDKLRPGYGFALYELGIVHRVWSKWDEALAYLDKAAKVPVQYRDVRDEEVEEQQRRTNEHDQAFP